MPLVPVLVREGSEDISNNLRTIRAAQSTTFQYTRPYSKFATTSKTTPFTVMTRSRSSKREKYSVIIPTYNERRNLPIITWLLARTFTEESVSPTDSTFQSPN